MFVTKHPLLCRINTTIPVYWYSVSIYNSFYQRTDSFAQHANNTPAAQQKIDLVLHVFCPEFH